MLDRDHLGVMDIRARRNAFGRQVRSFEADLDVRGLEGGPLRAMFIRAPWIEEHGPGVEVLARVDGHPVAASQDGITVVAFHPELGADRRLHERFLESVRLRANARPDPTAAPGRPRSPTPRGRGGRCSR
jgi:5'-phosphate synthase pdxT subunit